MVVIHVIMFIRKEDVWLCYLRSLISGYMQSVVHYLLKEDLLYHSLQCFDIAKVTRAPDPKGKSKTKAKANKGSAEIIAQYDYEDWSIHDNAMRARILKSYERFKVEIQSYLSMGDFTDFNSSRTVHSRLSCTPLVNKPLNFS